MIRFLILFLVLLHPEIARSQSDLLFSHGGIIRGDTTKKQLSIIFSADVFDDGIGFIQRALKQSDIEASFFFTGKFLEKESNKKRVTELLKSGNYVGSHSYGHLLYCDWENRDSLLISRKEFVQDITQSYELLREFGIQKEDAKYFLPSYEWYNDSVSKWAAGLGLRLINFTPGTYSNADYTTPDMGSRYLPSDTIYNRIMRFEEKESAGLNGFILLLHGGTDALRTDKFYFLLGKLIKDLKDKGYCFVRIDQLLQ